MQGDEAGTGFWTMVRPAINVQRTHETRYLYHHPMKNTTPWLLSRCYYCLQVLVLAGTSFETEVFGRRLRFGSVAGHRNGFVSLL